MLGTFRSGNASRAVTKDEAQKDEKEQNEQN
jgi:hypothetical protein